MPIWQFSIRPAVPEYYRRTPAERLSFFAEPGIVRDQHATRLAEVLDHVAAHVVAVPVRPAQQPLHPVR